MKDNFVEINKLGINETEKPQGIYRLKAIALKCKGKVLDIGCRKGFIQKYLPKSTEYYGVDFIDYSKYVKNFTKIDVTKHKLPFKSESFDTIILGEVLEHVINEGLVLKECRRVLKKDGVLIVSVPNYHINQCFTQIMHFDIKNHPVSEHIRSYWECELLNLMKLMGFKCVSIQRMYNNFHFRGLTIKLPEIALFSPFALYVLGVFKK